MALSDSAPIKLSEVKGQLADSIIGTTKTLGNCHDYVFGSGTRNLLDFLGTGTPTVSSLSATGGNSSIDVTFTLDNNGEFSCSFVAQYWVKTTDANPSPYYEELLGSSSTEGQHSFTITNNISNGNTYEVRVTAYNKFNNNGNYPAPRNTTGSWDWTNTAEATAQQPSLQTPTISSAFFANFDTDLDISISAGGNQDDFDIQYRVNGGTTETPTRQCSSGLTTTSPEIITQTDQFLQSGDTVEVRARATGTGFQDSNWSNWTTCFEGTVRNCPI